MHQAAWGRPLDGRPRVQLQLLLLGAARGLAREALQLGLGLVCCAGRPRERGLWGEDLPVLWQAYRAR